MKRSEMVQIIMNRLYGSESMSSNEAICSYILRGIEDAGMLPPDARVYTINETEVIKAEWEPEDEI